MEIPVPSDWDNQTWACFEIQWPDSPEWIAILAGLITSVQRGPFWRARNKIEVEQAKLLGRNVVSRNLPFVNCRTCPDENGSTGGPSVAIGATGGGGPCGDCCEEVCQVGCITSLEIIDGILYAYYGPCCRIEIGPVGSGEPLPDDPYNDNPDLPPVTEFSACGKATALVDTISAVVDAVWDARNDLPWTMLGNVKDRFPQISFSDIWLVNALAQALLVDALFGVDDIFDPEALQAVKCRLVNLFGDDADGLQSGDFSTIKGYFMGEFDLLIGNLYGMCINAIGEGDINDIVKLGATDIRDDCDCPPGGTGDVAGVTWAGGVSVTREDGTYNLIRRFNGGLSAEHEFVTTAGNFKAVGLVHAFDIAFGTSVDDMLLAMVPVAPTDELLHSDWHTSGCNHIDEDAAIGSIEATDRTSQTISFEAGAVWLNEVWSAGKTTLDWSNAEMRSCPQTQPSPKTYRWVMHIARVNGVATGVISIPAGI